MARKNIYPGDVFGRWTVLSSAEKSAKNETKWHCRCNCGTERDVLERGLLYGGSLSCGCLARERAAEKNTWDLQGKVLGELTVLERSDKRNGGIKWRCRCSCGKLINYPATLLATGKRTHCGCKMVKQYAYTDIAGKRFGRLTVMNRLEKPDACGSAMWNCRCDCGKIVRVSYNNLVYGGIKSCGCARREHEKTLGKFLTHIDGTSVDMLKSKKLPSNNTTGVKGVYRIRGKYTAKIVFQKKQIFLGTYEHFEDAANARKEAERMVNDRIVAYYARWKARAKEDPAWAQQNPIRFKLQKSDQGSLVLSIIPDIGI